MRRTRTVRIVIALLVVLTLIASAAPAFADSQPPPPVGGGLGITEDDIVDLSIPPMPPGVSSGTRLYVRTAAVNPTEYLVIREAIFNAGFPDVLEVSPGTLVVDIKDNDPDEAADVLSEIIGVTEVALAPANGIVIDTADPIEFPSLWVVLAALTALGAGALVIVRRFTVPDAS